MGLFDALSAQTPQGNQLRAGLLGLGAGLLGGSTGHYGQFAPAMGQGLLGMAGGMQQAAENDQRQQVMDMKKRQAEAEMAQQAGFQQFFSPSAPPSGSVTAPAGANPAGVAPGPAAGITRDRVEQAMLSGNPMLIDWASKASSVLPKDGPTPLVQNLTAAGLQPGTPAFQRAVLENVNPGQRPTSLMQNLSAAGLQPGTPEYRDAVLQGTRGTTINVGAGEKAWETESAKLFAKRYDDLTTQAQSAQQMLGLYDLAQAGLDSGVRTGSFGGAEQAVRQMGLALGIGNADKIAGGELLTAVQNRMALQMRSPDSGMGMPGAVSDRDLTFLKDAQIGLDRSPEGNRRMLDAFRKLEQRKLEIARLADQYIQQNGRLDVGFNQAVRQYAAANPMFPDQKGDRAAQLDQIMGF